MGRVLLFLPLCLLSSCYSYAPYENYGYHQPFPAGYGANYPSNDAHGSAPNHGLQTYAPYDGEPNYQGSDRPGFATSVPEDGQPILLTPLPAPSQPGQGDNQPFSGVSPTDLNQPQFNQGTPPGYGNQPASCDTPENPMACD
jgi:hypothetical protein